MPKVVIVDLQNVLIFKKEGSANFDPFLANGLSIFDFNNDLLELLTKLDLTWYCFTNLKNVNLDFDLASKFNSFGCKAIFEAGQLGLDKGSAYAYEFITKNKLGVKTEDTYYIDDLERNVKAAQNAGLHSLLYKNAKQAENWLKSIVAG